MIICASMTILPLVISFYDGVVLVVLGSSIDSFVIEHVMCPMRK